MIVDHIDLRTKYERDAGTILLTGIQALVRLPVEMRRVDARNRLNTSAFITGYEGSPLGAYDTALARERTLLEAHDIHFWAGLNEDIAATAIWGTQTIPRRRPDVDGVIGIWYGKAPGVDRAGDVIRHGNYQGTSPTGGVLLLAGDDPACKSSTLPSASEGTLADAGLPVLYPGSVQEVIDFGLHGIAMSRYTGSWVGFKITTDVADGFGTAVVDADRFDPVIPRIEVDGVPWHHEQVHVMLAPHSVRAEAAVFRPRVKAAEAYAAANGLDRIAVNPKQATLGIVSAGKTWYDLRQSLADMGLVDDELIRRGIRLLKLGMISPVEPTIVRRFADGLDTIIVVEEKRPFIERAIKDILYHAPDRPFIMGAEDTEGNAFIPVDGELVPDRITDTLGPWLAQRHPDLPIMQRLDALAAARRRRALTVDSHRSPYFCSGCPHNRSTMIPEGSLAGAGIGCHAMVHFTGDPTRSAEGITHMGGEGAQWIGQAMYSEAGHMFQNIGDGTFFHSGSLAVRACVAANANITFKLLYNAAVAMTGGQEATGARPVPEVAAMLLAEGVKKVIVCAEDPAKYPPRTRWVDGVDVWHRDRLLEAQEKLAAIEGTTALIYDQQCAAEARRERKRGTQADPKTRVFINEMLCEGCGDCGDKSNCLSVQPVDTEFGRKTTIHQSSCNKDYSCLNGDCPSFVTVETTRVSASAKPVRVVHEAPPAPEPKRPVVDGVFSLYLMGIGGTGIVTANQVLATAAAMEGYQINGLDQTGLSQKAGPVVSHLKLLTDHTETACRVVAASVDTYLGFDELVAVDSRHLAMTSAHTAAIVSTSEVPTGHMVRNHDLRLPERSAVRDKIDSMTGAGTYVDSLDMAERLFGTHMAANTLLIGAAYQAGAIPMSAEAIERAIELNGVAVEMNKRAFRWGRALVDDPSSVERVSDPAPEALMAPRRREADPQVAAMLDGTAIDGEVARLVRIRTAQLIGYQNQKVAARYVAMVDRVVRAEDAIAPGDRRLAEAVARYLYKLTAYKDEYEVARLFLDPGFDAALRAELPTGAKLKYHLHPPVLRSLGVTKKWRFGTWVRPVFRVLRAMRRLRGTAFDPFRFAEVRRVERELLDEYTSTISGLVDGLDATSHERAIALAELPEIIRGYEHIKLRSVAVYRSKRADLLAG